MNKDKMMKWICTHKVSVPERTMWVALMCPQCVDNKNSFKYEAPLRVGDFLGCYDLYRFARLTPDDLRKVGEIFPHWKPIIEVWDNLISALEEERYAYMYGIFIQIRRKSIVQNRHGEMTKIRGAYLTRVLNEKDIEYPALQGQKLTALLETHYNLFHTDLIRRALTDDYITLSSFGNGIREILRAEAKDNDEFVPDRWERYI